MLLIDEIPLLELTASEVEQIEAKLYASIPEVAPDDVIRLVNDWRKHRQAIASLLRLFRPSADGHFYFVDAMRWDTFEHLKKSAGL